MSFEGYHQLDGREEANISCCMISRRCNERHFLKSLEMFQVEADNVLMVVQLHQKESFLLSSSMEQKAYKVIFFFACFACR